jgi:hypothetical protein
MKRRQQYDSIVFLNFLNFLKNQTKRVNSFFYSYLLADNFEV